MTLHLNSIDRAPTDKRATVAGVSRAWISSNGNGYTYRNMRDTKADILAHGYFCDVWRILSGEAQEGDIVMCSCRDGAMILHFTGGGNVDTVS